MKRCPPGWSRFKNEKCFKIVTTEPLVNHDAAQLACEALGSTLASVTSESERTFLRSLLLRDAADETGLKSLWIGLRRKFNSLFWYDLTQDNFDSVPGQAVNPVWALALNSILPGADCGSLDTDAVTMANATANFARLAMADCLALKGYVCQKFVTEKGCGCGSN